MDRLITFPGKRAEEIRSAIERTVREYEKAAPGVLSWVWSGPLDARGSVKAFGKTIDAFCVVSEQKALVRIGDVDPMTTVLVTSFLMDLESKVKANLR
jgi:hypothetical protein